MHQRSGTTAVDYYAANPRALINASMHVLTIARLGITELVPEYPTTA